MQRKIIILLLLICVGMFTLLMILENNIDIPILQKNINIDSYVKTITDYKKSGDENYLAQKYDEAISDYSHVLELDPENALVYEDRGNAYIKVGKYDEATSDYKHSLELNSSNELLQQKTQNLQKAQEYYDKGEEYLKNLNWKEAINEYNKTIQLAPYYAEAYVGRGKAYFWQLDPEEWDRVVLTEYSRAMEINPKCVPAYIGRGWLYYNQHKYELAISDFTYAVELEPDNIKAYEGRAFVYSAYDHKKDKSYLDKAMADYNKLAILDPDNFVYHHSLGKIYYNKGEYDKAIEQYKISIKLSNNPNAEKDEIEEAEIAKKMHGY